MRYYESDEFRIFSFHEYMLLAFLKDIIDLNSKHENSSSTYPNWSLF